MVALIWWEIIGFMDIGYLEKEKEYRIKKRSTWHENRSKVPGFVEAWFSSAANVTFAENGQTGRKTT